MDYFYEFWAHVNSESKAETLPAGISLLFRVYENQQVGGAAWNTADIPLILLQLVAHGNPPFSDLPRFEAGIMLQLLLCCETSDNNDTT